MIYKFYDTCSLLLDVDNLFQEEDTRMVISSITLEELENIKTAQNKDFNVKYSARCVLRKLEKYYGDYDIVLFNNDMIIDNMPDNNDAKIIACARRFKVFHSADTVIFVTNDLSCKHLAHLYFGDDVESIIEEKEAYSGYKEVYLNETEMSEFYSNPYINHYNLYINQYLLVYNAETKECVDRLCWTGEEYRHIGYDTFGSQYFGDVKPLKGDVYQQLAADSLMKNKITMVKGPAGSGKAQPNSTKIPMADGSIKYLGDIQVGDQILDRKGQPTKVLAVYPQGKKDNYKITFSDGRVAYCNDEHLWATYTSKGNLKNRTLREMIDHGFYKYQNDKHIYYYQIPTNEPISYTDYNYEIDPYVIGCFLGDGCCKENALTLSSNDEFIVNEVARLIGAIPNKCSEANYSWTFKYPENSREYISDTRNYLLKQFNTQKFFNKYIDEICTNCYAKRIPNEYKMGSILQRKSLLQGLLDTDGTIDTQKGRVRFASTSYNLVKDIQEVCWSLGYLATISEDNRKDKYTTHVCYTVSISAPICDKINLFRLPRKKDIAIKLASESKKERLYNSITISNIEKLNTQEEMTCILVDNPEHLYLTEDFIVTHNTYLSLGYLLHLLSRRKIDRIIIFCNTVATKNSARLGYYPGTKDQKLLDSQIGNLLSSKLGGRILVEQMIQQEQLVLLPMSDIRGYDTSGMRAGIYISEAQNLDIDLMKLALQRIGEDSVCIIDGDYNQQVDDVNFAGSNNGMRRASKVFRGSDIYGEVTLKTIHRSKIAQLAENM